MDRSDLREVIYRSIASIPRTEENEPFVEYLEQLTKERDVRGVGAFLDDLTSNPDSVHHSESARNTVRPIVKVDEEENPDFSRRYALKWGARQLGEKMILSHVALELLPKTELMQSFQKNVSAPEITASSHINNVAKAGIRMALGPENLQVLSEVTQRLSALSVGISKGVDTIDAIGFEIDYAKQNRLEKDLTKLLTEMAPTMSEIVLQQGQKGELGYDVSTPLPTPSHKSHTPASLHK